MYNKYKIGDKITICKNLYNGICIGDIGIIKSEIINRYGVKLFEILIRGKSFYFTQDYIKIINESEGKEMNKLTGFNKVAVIKINNSTYHYALYDDDINVGDKVLVSGACQNVLTVDEIITVEEARNRYDKDIIAEVKCKVDFSSYDKRLKNRLKALELRKKMDKKIAEMDEMNKYVVYAERNPELAAMLEEYKELVL